MEKKQIYDDRIQRLELKEIKILYANTLDKNMLIESLFPEMDTSDPRSVNYQRTLVRPEIRWGVLLLNIIVMLILPVVIFYMTRYWGADHSVAMVTVAISMLGYGVIRLKSIALCTVRLYQHFAPDYIRNRCRFEPSCSEYMVLTVSKYGAIRGIRKGVHRLKRCNHYGGGYDWP